MPAPPGARLADRLPALGRATFPRTTFRDTASRWSFPGYRDRGRIAAGRRYPRFVEGQYDGVADGYRRYHLLRSGSREDRLAAGEWSWAWDAVDDAVRSAAMPVTLTLLDELLAHPEADTGYIGAGPVEDILHLDAIEDWIDELARRCRTSAVWREAVYAAVWPDEASLHRLRPYLRPLAQDAPQVARARTDNRKTGRDIGQSRRHRRELPVAVPSMGRVQGSLHRGVALLGSAGSYVPGRGTVPPRQRTSDGRPGPDHGPDARD